MPDYVVIDVDVVPTVGTQARGVAVWRVNAATEAAAAAQVGDLAGEVVPQKRFVDLASNFTRYQTSPNLTHSAVAG